MPAAQSKRAASSTSNSTVAATDLNSPVPTTSEPYTIRRTPLSRLQGAVFLIALLLNGVYICCVILPLFALLLPINIALAQRVLDFFVAAYLSLPASLLELYGVRIHCYGDAPPPSQRGEYSVLVSNHPTELDWMYLWHWLYRYSDLTQLKIVMKGALRRAPVIGWALQLACHLFLARDWQKDQKHVQRLIQHYLRAMQPASASIRSLFDSLLGRPSLQLLIFPEGTNMRPAAKERSDAFAAERQLPAYTHVLHPRTTGFVYIMDQLTAAEATQQTEKEARLRAVYDMTVAFPGTRCANIKQLVQGYLPSDISFYCRRFAIDELPTSTHSAISASTTSTAKPKAQETPTEVSPTAPLALWLDERYRVKEAQLEAFYSHRDRRYYNEKGEAEAELPALSTGSWLLLRCLAACWLLFGALMTYMTAVWSAWRWYMLACVLAFTAVSWVGGGDAFVLWLEQRTTSGGRKVAPRGRQGKKMR